jgi:VanZ family protein
MTKLLRSLLFIACLAIILFFGLKADPEVPKKMAPEDVRIFFNTFDAFRNQLAFGLFGIAALLLLTDRRIVNWKQIAAVALIAVLIPALELAQIWMPQRHVSFDDVLNGWLGLGLACLVYLVARWLWRVVTREGSKTDLATRRGGH